MALAQFWEQLHFNRYPISTIKWWTVYTRVDCKWLYNAEHNVQAYGIETEGGNFVFLNSRGDTCSNLDL